MVEDTGFIVLPVDINDTSKGVMVLPMLSSSYPDLDCDGIANVNDVDMDGDGIENGADAFPLDQNESIDTDNDGIGNNADTDDDNDGFSDVLEIAKGTNPLDANEFPVNTPPIALTQHIIVDENTTDNNITLHGEDAEDDILTYTILSLPLHGTLTGSVTNLQYTPTAGYFGDDSFSFRVNDAEFDSNISLVNIQVNSFLAKANIGEQLFFDTNLSLTRNTSCATCHNPDHAFIDNRFLADGIDQNIFAHGALSVGDDGFSLGGRNAPTISYAQFIPTSSISNTGFPNGGQFHDGRVATLKHQAMGPPTNPLEMQMGSKGDVVTRIKENPQYVATFKTLFGNDIFDNNTTAYEAMGEVIGQFEKTKEFAPFDSKFDKFQDCRSEGNTRAQCLQSGNWTTDETNGMDMILEGGGTMCFFCHLNIASNPTPRETFTNYRYRNVGTPRNLNTLTLREALGLGQLSDIDHGIFTAFPTLSEANFDGAFKVPTLRNVAVTAPYMHNGVFKNLRTVLEFYDHLGQGNRPINPETNTTWGAPNVTTSIHGVLSLNKSMTDNDIDAILAFLKTLTDARYEHLLD